MKRSNGSGGSSEWREIVASALDWEQAHVSLDRAVEDLPADLRGRRPDGAPYSVWEQLEHIRIAQHDLLDFCRNADYHHDLEWPAEYWPDSPGPPSDQAWDECLAAVRKDRAELQRWTLEAEVDLTEKIPHGTGQTYLRTVLVAADHAAYHVGQIVMIRKLLGAWSALVLAFGVAASGVVAQDDEPELRGEVVSSATGEPIAGAWVAMEGYGYGTYSKRDGDFRLPEVPAAPRRYDVHALGYVPSVLTLEAASGEQVIELEPDEAVLPGLEFLLAHLENRRNAGRVFDRQALAFSGAYDLGEFLKMRGVRRVRKFCLDEVTTPGLQRVPPEDFFMVEIHGSTVRAYTEEFLDRTARQDREAIEDIVRLQLPMC